MTRRWKRKADYGETPPKGRNAAIKNSEVGETMIHKVAMQNSRRCMGGGQLEWTGTIMSSSGHHIRGR